MTRHVLVLDLNNPTRREEIIKHLPRSCAPVYEPTGCAWYLAHVDSEALATYQLLDSGQQRRWVWYAGGENVRVPGGELVRRAVTESAPLTEDELQAIDAWISSPGDPRPSILSGIPLSYLRALWLLCEGAAMGPRPDERYWKPILDDAFVAKAHAEAKSIFKDPLRIDVATKALRQAIVDHQESEVGKAARQLAEHLRPHCESVL